MKKIDKIKKAKKDCIFFAEEYLKHLIPSESGKFHRELLEIIVNEKNKRLDILAPRGHAKSTWITIIFVIWNIVRNRNISIVIASDTAEQAESFLRLIKDELEYNIRILEDFGLFRPPEKTTQTTIWRAQQITVERETRSKEPTIVCGGTGKKIVGRRADLIIVDDPLNDENTDSENQRFKTLKWFMKTLSPIAKPNTGRIIVIGTKKHAEDLHTALGKNSIYKQYIYKALDDSKNPLWPEEWPYEKLMEKKSEIGDLFFEQEYQNEPLDITNILFKENILKSMKDYEYDKRKKGKKFMGVYIPLNISGKSIEKIYTKYTVYIVIRIDDMENRYIDKIYFAKGIKINDILYILKGTILNYRPEITCVEQEVFEILDMNNLLDEELQITGHDKNNKNNIFNGIPKIIWLLEKKKIHMNYKDEGEREKSIFLYEKFKIFDLNNQNEFVIAYWLAEQAYRLSKMYDSSIEIISDPT